MQYIKEFSSFSVEIDMVAEHPAPGSDARQFASKIEVLDAGSGQLVFGPGPPQNPSTYDCMLTGLSVGDEIPGPIGCIRTGTNLGKVRVWWS